MTHRIFAPGSGPLADWLRKEARPGDHVHLVEDETYETRGAVLDGALLDGPLRLSFEGARLKHRSDALVTSPVLELVHLSGWELYDPWTEGTWHAGMAGEKIRSDQQHGLAIRGCHRILIARHISRGTWADGCYLSHIDEGDELDNVAICGAFYDECGRHGLAVVQGTDVAAVAIRGRGIERTFLNGEVHLNRTVRRYHVEDASLEAMLVDGQLHAPLRTLTMTGRGDVADFQLDGLRIDGRLYFAVNVWGTGAEEWGAPLKSGYGKRENVTIRRVRGAKREPVDANGIPTKRYSKPRQTTPWYQAQFLNVDGLTIEDVPYPVDTRGST